MASSLQKEVMDQGSFLIVAAPQQQMGKGQDLGKSLRSFSYRSRYIDPLEQPIQISICILRN